MVVGLRFALDVNSWAYDRIFCFIINRNSVHPACRRIRSYAYGCTPSPRADRKRAKFRHFIPKKLCRFNVLLRIYNNDVIIARSDVVSNMLRDFFIIFATKRQWRNKPCNCFLLFVLSVLVSSWLTSRLELSQSGRLFDSCWARSDWLVSKMSSMFGWIIFKLKYFYGSLGIVPWLRQLC